MKSSDLAYSLFIKCEIDGIEQLLGLDYVEDNSNYNVNSDITTHPLVNGDIIADHMYIRASTANYSGTFSLIGNKKGITYIEEDSFERVVDYSNDIHSRLSIIQKIFERINREGILCTIIRRSNNGEDSRFLVRENMALTSITWTEHQYSVDFSFGFTEALTAVVEKEEYLPQVLDEDLPNLNAPVQADLSDVFIHYDDLKRQIKDILKQNYLLTEMERFWYSAKSLGRFIFSSPYKIKDNWNKMWENTAFQDKINALAEASDDKLDEFVNKFLDKFNELENYISLYKFNQNIDQQCLITIDNVLYCFTATKSTQNGNYTLTVTHVENNIEKNDKQIGDISQKCIRGLDSCNQDSILFTTKSNTQVYLGLLYDIGADVRKYKTLQELDVAMDKELKDLSNYGIVISSIDLYHYQEILLGMFTEVLEEFEI